MLGLLGEIIFLVSMLEELGDDVVGVVVDVVSKSDDCLPYCCMNLSSPLVVLFVVEFVVDAMFCFLSIFIVVLVLLARNWSRRT